MSILEDPGQAAPVQEWRTAFARSLEQQKERAQQLLQSRREKLASLQADLSCRLAELADELARSQTASLERGISLDSQQSTLQSSQAEIQRQTAELTAQYTRWEEAQTNARTAQAELLTQLQQRLSELNVRQAAIDESQQQLHAERSEIAAREATTNHSLTEFASKKAELEERSTKLAQLQAGVAEERAQLASLREELTKREEAVARQRRTVARQLRTRKSEMMAEVESLRREASAVPGQDFELQMRCSELQGKCDRLREEASELSEQREELQERLSTAQQQVAERQGGLIQAQKQSEQIQARFQKLELQQAETAQERDQLKAETSRLSAELEKVREQLQTAGRQHSGDAAASGELRRLREENKQLETMLKEAEAAKEAAQVVGEDGSPEGSQEVADLRKRLEMATADCRELKGRNSELQNQLSKKGGGGSKSGSGSASPMDWEAQKQRMLAQLESDYDDSDPAQKAERLDIAKAVELTDQALSAKSQEVGELRHELDELRKLLENQSNNIGQFAVGASAFAELLDKDELVRHERENLQKMQDGLREQLKKAEIDISMERAKIARDRAELDEQLHSMQQEKAQQVAANPASGGDKGKKTTRGRWLSRLGLSDAESS